MSMATTPDGKLPFFGIGRVRFRVMFRIRVSFRFNVGSCHACVGVASWPACLSDGQYQCDSGQCVSIDDVCDGRGHCDDQSDELNCRMSLSLPLCLSLSVCVCVCVCVSLSVSHQACQSLLEHTVPVPSSARVRSISGRGGGLVPGQGALSPIQRFWKHCKPPPQWLSGLWRASNSFFPAFSVVMMSLLSLCIIDYSVGWRYWKIQIVSGKFPSLRILLPSMRSPVCFYVSRVCPYLIRRYRSSVNSLKILSVLALLCAYVCVELLSECSVNNGGCSQRCRSYSANNVTTSSAQRRCSCESGYQLQRDKLTCAGQLSTSL